ncbi:MAG: MBG domain-containing protein [Ferruginibacter sp.]
MKKLITILFILFCSYSNAAVVTYYFSNSGSDGNNGVTTGTPFKTIAKANTLSLNPGDVLSFNGGQTFYGNLIIHNSGSSGNPIIINSYGTGNAVISGFTSVTSWTNLGGNIWESSSAVSSLSTCNMVVVNGVNTAQGRTPNTGSYYTYQSYSGTTSITSSNLNSSVINWTGAEVAMLVNRYTLGRNPITSQSGGTLNYTSTTGDGVNGNNRPFIIQNDPRTLDVQNEWYYNPATKKIRIYSTSSPTGVQISTVDTLVYLSNNKNYISFQNIDFTGSNKATIENLNAKYNTYTNCNFLFAGQSGVHNSYGGAATGMGFYNCTFNQINGSAIDLSGDADAVTVNNCTVVNVGMVFGAGEKNGVGYSAIKNIGDNGSFSLNTLSNIGYVGIEFRGNNSRVDSNIISGFCSVLSDGGGIYTYNGSNATFTGRKVRYNILSAAPNSQGIYMDDLANGVDIQHNSVSGCDIGIYLHGTKNITVTNNTSFNNSSYQFEMADEPARGSNPAELFSNLTINNNKFISYAPSQVVFLIIAQTNYLSTLGVMNNNYYCRPINDNLTFLVQIVSPSTYTNYNLAQWKTFSGQDGSSNKSPLAITNVNQLSSYTAYKNDSVMNVPPSVDMANASYSGTPTLSAYSSLVLIQTASLITPTITWASQSAVYGASLNPTHTATSGGVAGTFSYNISGTPNAGVYNTYAVTFTPSDQSTYAITIKTVTLTITPAPITGTVSGTSVTFNGSPQQPILTTSPTVGIAYSVLLNGVSGGQTHAGSSTYTIGLNNSNYSMTALTGTFTVNPQTISVSVGNILQTYDSTLRNVTVTTTPSGIATTNSLPSKRYSGIYPGTIISANSDYTFTTVNFNLTINKGIFNYTWNPATPITYPTPLGASQANASSTKGASYAYTPPVATLLSAGSQTLKLDITPNDTNLLSITNITKNITVNKGTQTIDTSNTTQYADGSVKNISASVASNTGTITTVYTGGHTAPGDYPFTSTYSDANWQASPVSGTLHLLSNAATIYITNFANRIFTGSPISVTVTTPYSYAVTYDGSPTPPTNVNTSIQVIATINDGIHVGADTVTMNIIKENPSYTWSTITGGMFPYIVTSGILNATSPVSINWTYNVAVGDTISVGTFGIIATGTPTDLSNYNIVSATQYVTVTNNSATISATGFNQVYDSTPKPISASTTPANLPLVILYAGSPTPPTGSGKYFTTVNLASGTNYIATGISDTLTISKGTSILTWQQPLPFQQGSALTSLQLSMTANRDGIITYNFPIGSVFNTSGIYTIIGTFTPTNSNYQIQTKSIQLTVYGNPTLDIFILHGVPFPIDEPLNIPLF